MNKIYEQIKNIFDIKDYTFTPVTGHEGGRNRIIIVSKNEDKQYILRIADLGDRSEKDYLAETEYVHYLAENGAPVADVIPSVNGRLVESMEAEGKTVYVSLFAYAKGMLLVDNGYRYREGASLDEYFYNTGKALGAIHRLSKEYEPVHPRQDYFDKYGMDEGRLFYFIDRSFVKLRNISLTYNLPKKWLGPFTGVSVSAFVNNAFTWTAKDNYYVDPESTNEGTDVGGLFGETYVNPSCRIYGFNLNIKF